MTPYGTLKKLTEFDTRQDEHMCKYYSNLNFKIKWIIYLSCKSWYFYESGKYQLLFYLYDTFENVFKNKYVSLNC